jgi:hypothetical protein
MIAGTKHYTALLKNQFAEHPLRTILLLAFLFRLIAVFFAKGYMMHDDHFLTVEPAGSWADGSNFNHWLPGVGNNNLHPEPISFFYPGVLYVLFSLFQSLGIEHPETQMTLIRLLHAAYSLLTIYFAYKITARISNRSNAIQVGLLLACIAIMPNFSVRNLVEMVSMPPLLAGIYLIVSLIPLKNFQVGGQTFHGYEESNIAKTRNIIFLLIAAIIMGATVGIRYQTGLFVALTGLVLLLQRNFLCAFIFGVVSFSAFFLTQIDDVLLWGGEPFQHLRGYFEYNKKNALNYPGSPFAYLSFIGIFILPPVSLYLLAGYFKSFKRHLIIWLPTTGFLLFHILYPNRQERFILPALPFFVMLGVIGWNELMNTSTRLQKYRSQIRAGWIFFWSLNTMVMLLLCFTYTKKSRVEAMNYLYMQGDCRNFVLEFTHSDAGAMMPQFYSNNWSGYYYFRKGDNPVDYILNMEHDERTTEGKLQPRLIPNYFLFYDDENLEQRVALFKRYFPSLEYKETIQPGWFDQTLNALNPKNSLEKIHIYHADGGIQQ